MSHRVNKNYYVVSSEVKIKKKNRPITDGENNNYVVLEKPGTASNGVTSVLCSSCDQTEIDVNVQICRSDAGKCNGEVANVYERVHACTVNTV